MNLNNIPTGIFVPDDVYVIIEIQANSISVKYEIKKKYGVIFVDRFINTPLIYPCNYGYINNTLSNDGDPLDTLVITPYPLIPYSVIHSRPIGLLKMLDESGKDSKIICVPNYDISNEYKKIKDIFDLSPYLLNKIFYFFKQYKSLEKGKWVKVDCWCNVDYAKNEILKSYKKFLNKKKLKK